MTDYDISVIYDVFEHSAEIRKNNVPIDIYSAMGGYVNRDFVDWFDSLCYDAYREVNTDFSISFCGPKLYSIMLERESSNNSHCTGYSETSPAFSISRSQRLDWLSTLATMSHDINRTVGALSIQLCVEDSIMPQVDAAIHRCSDVSGSSGSYRFQLSQSTAIPLRVSRLSESTTHSSSSLRVVVIPADCVAAAATASGASQSITYAIDTAASGCPEYIGKTADNCFVFSGNQNELGSLIGMAMDALVLPQVYVSASSYAKADNTVSFHSDPSVRLMPTALISNVPVCTAVIPNRIELNTSLPIAITVLPKTSIELHLSVPGAIKSDGKTITGVTPGNVDIAIRPKNSSLLMYSCSVNVYQVFKVTSISLAASSTSVYAGDVVDVSATFSPANSADIGTQRWTVSRSDVLSEQSRGRFLALRSGSCSITVSVGRVSKSITFQVKDTAQQLVLPTKAFSMKITQPPQSLIPSIKPSSATNGSITQSVADTLVAVYDDVAKTIRPINIGTTTISFYLHTQKGIVDHQTIPVEILPPYRVENPPASLVLMILCAILSLATLFTVASPVFAILSAVCGVWHLIAQKFSLRSIITVAICIAATIGIYMISQGFWII